MKISSMIRRIIIIASHHHHADAASSCEEHMHVALMSSISYVRMCDDDVIMNADVRSVGVSIMM